MEALLSRVRENLARFERRERTERGLRRAGVALPLLANGDGEPCFLLTRRATRLDRHAGQFAFPGGRVDPGETAEQAALRELREEVGLSVSRSDVLGRLDDYVTHVTRSGFVMTPFVVYVRESSALRADPREVQAVHVVPLAALEHPDVPQLRRIPQSPRPVLSVPLEEPLGTWIHAPTAALLFQLREVAIHGRSTRVAHYDGPVFTWS